MTDPTETGPSPAVAFDGPLTIRIDGEHAVISTDGGSSEQVSAHAIAAAVAAALAGRHREHRSAVAEPAPMAPTLSAGAAATVAEAAATAPVVTPHAQLPPRGRLDALAAVEVRPSLGDEPFSAVVAARCSTRSLVSPDASTVLAALAGCIQTRATGLGDDGWLLRRRAAPSAGGRHGIDAVLVTTGLNGLDNGAWHLDGELLRATRLGLDDDTLDPLRAEAAAAAGLTGAPPALAVLVADFSATLARYPGGASLVWRDAGALASTLHLACTAAGLGSVILGVGGPVASPLRAALGWDDARGLALVGAVGISAAASTP